MCNDSIKEIIMPYNANQHWVLLYANLEDEYVCMMNSSPMVFMNDTAVLEKFM